MPPNPADGGPATRIVQLTEAVTLEELANDEEYSDILEDMRDECSKVLFLRVLVFIFHRNKGAP